MQDGSESSRRNGVPGLATLGSLKHLQLAIANRVRPKPSVDLVPLRHSVGRVLAHPLSRSHGRGTLIHQGATMMANHVPLLAQQGLSAVAVREKVCVGIVTLGGGAQGNGVQEAPDLRLAAASSAVVATVLATAVDQLGAQVLEATCDAGCGRAMADCMDQLRRRCDLVLIAGAVGHGQMTALRDGMAELGAELASEEVKAWPLGELHMINIGEWLAIAFPTHPANAFASFVMLVSPLIRRLQGRAELLPEMEVAAIDGPMPTTNGWGLFCVIECATEPLATYRLKWCKRHDSASSIAEASGLAWRPLDLGLRRESSVAFYPFRRWLG